MAIDKIVDYLKIALAATFIGTIFSIILGFITPALGSWQFIVFLIYGLITIYAITWGLPKSVDTFPEILAATFFILAVSGLIGMFVPFPQLQWFSLTSTTGILTSLAVALFSVSIVRKVLD